MKYKYDVFISYSRRDYVDESYNVIPGNAIAEIQNVFDENGITYWFDKDGIYSDTCIVPLPKNKRILKKLDLIYLFTFCCFTFVALTNVWLISINYKLIIEI